MRRISRILAITLILTLIANTALAACGKRLKGSDW